MRSRLMRGSMVVMTGVAVVALVALAVARPASQGTRVDRINGRPNLSGIWQANNEANWDLRAHKARAGAVMQPGVYPSIRFRTGTSRPVTPLWRGRRRARIARGGGRRRSDSVYPGGPGAEAGQRGASGSLPAALSVSRAGESGARGRLQFRARLRGRCGRHPVAR